jgi:hypothetical protein
MNITPIIFFDMVAAILVLALALIAIIIYLFRVLKDFHSCAKAKYGTLQENGNIPDATKMKAVKIIDDANNQALDIVNSVTLSTNATSERLKESLEHISSTQIEEFKKTTSDFIKIYSQVLQDLKIKNIEVFQKTSEDIEVNTAAEIKNFKESMQKLTTLSQGEVKKKIDVDYETLKKEIEEYRKIELQKIDSKIYGFLEKISKLVLGKALNLSEHGDLIEKSLEKAIKEGAFKT